MFLGCRDDVIVLLFIVRRSSCIIFIITTFGTTFFLFCLLFEWSDVFSAHATSVPAGWLVRITLSWLGLGKKLLAIFFSVSPETVINAFWNGSSVAREKRSKPKFCARMLGEV